MHDHVTVIIFTLITIVVHQNLSTSVTLASFGKISSPSQPCGVGDIFLAHFGPFSTNWASFKRHSLPEYCCWPCPSLYDYSVPVFWCYFQQDNAPCHKAQIISDWFLEHDNEFTLLKWPPQSPDLNPIEHLWDVVEREIHIMDVQPSNLQQLCDDIMSIWTKISEECFQHLVESMPRRIKAVLKAKWGPTRY